MLFLLLQVAFASIHLPEIVFPPDTTVIMHNEHGQETQIPCTDCIFNRVDDLLGRQSYIPGEFHFQDDCDQGYWCCRENPKIGGLFNQDRYGGLYGQVDAFTIPNFEKIPAIIHYELRDLPFAAYRNREIYYLRCSHHSFSVDNLKLLQKYGNTLEHRVKIVEGTRLWNRDISGIKAISGMKDISPNKTYIFFHLLLNKLVRQTFLELKRFFRRHFRVTTEIWQDVHPRKAVLFFKILFSKLVQHKTLALQRFFGIVARHRTKIEKLTIFHQFFK